MRLRDHKTQKDLWVFVLSPDKVTGVFEWYDLGEWIEEGREGVLHVDTYGGAFVIDCVEVSAVSSATTGRK